MSANLKKLASTLLAFTAVSGPANAQSYMMSDQDICRGMLTLADVKQVLFPNTRVIFAQQSDVMACKVRLKPDGRVDVLGTYYLKDTTAANAYHNDFINAAAQEKSVPAPAVRQPAARPQVQERPPRAPRATPHRPSTRTQSAPRAASHRSAPSTIRIPKSHPNCGPMRSNETVDAFKTRRSQPECRIQIGQAKESSMSTTLKFALATLATALSTTATAQMPPQENAHTPQQSYPTRPLTLDEKCRQAVKKEAITMSVSGMGILERENFACILKTGVDKDVPLVVESINTRFSYGRNMLAERKDRIALMDKIAEEKSSAATPLPGTPIPPVSADDACAALIKTTQLTPLSYNSRAYAENTRYGCITHNGVLQQSFDKARTEENIAFSRLITAGNPNKWGIILQRQRDAKLIPRN